MRPGHPTVVPTPAPAQNLSVLPGAHALLTSEGSSLVAARAASAAFLALRALSIWHTNTNMKSCCATRLSLRLSFLPLS